MKPAARHQEGHAATSERSLASRLRVPSRNLGIALVCLFLLVLAATRGQMVFASASSGAASWSAAQARAVASLTDYAATGDPAAYADYRASMATLEAFHVARDQMLAQRPFDEIRHTLVAGNIRILSQRPTVFAFAHFNQAPYLRDAMQAWRRTDAPLRRLEVQAQDLRRAYAAGHPAQAYIAARIAAIDAISRQTAHDSAMFSLSIATATIAVGRLLYATVLAFALAIALLWFLLSRRILVGAHADHEHLRHLATHEPLTGLVNRQEFVRRCNAALRQAQAQATLAAVMFIDLDGFKGINDSYGHARGDDLLCIVARRIAAALHPGDVAARLGGDEFAVLQVDIDEPSAAETLARRLSSALATPFRIGGDSAVFGASIGVAVSHGEADASALLAHADQAMYLAKRNKPNAWRMYQPSARPFAHACQA